MKNLDQLTDEELRELLSKPLSKEEEKLFLELDRADRGLLAQNFRKVNLSDEEALKLAKALDKARQDASWLLALNLRESDPDYDPAKDPTCVQVTIKNNKK